MAAGVDIVVIGLTEPVESAVPVMVLVIGPSGPSVVIVVVITGGTVNCEDGNGLYMVVEVDVSMGGLPVSVEPGDGGCEGKGAEGKPDVTVPGCVGI